MTVRLVEHGSHSRCLGYMPGVANQLNSSKASLFFSRFEAQIEKIMIINKKLHASAFSGSNSEESYPQ